MLNKKELRPCGGVLFLLFYLGTLLENGSEPPKTSTENKVVNVQFFGSFFKGIDTCLAVAVCIGYKNYFSGSFFCS